jgi:hypothetical protein
MKSKGNFDCLPTDTKRLNVTFVKELTWQTVSKSKQYKSQKRETELSETWPLGFGVHHAL